MRGLKQFSWFPIRIRQEEPYQCKALCVHSIEIQGKKRTQISIECHVKSQQLPPMCMDEGLSTHLHICCSFYRAPSTLSFLWHTHTAYISMVHSHCPSGTTNSQSHFTIVQVPIKFYSKFHVPMMTDFVYIAESCV